MTTNNQNIGIVCPVPMGDWQANVPYRKLNIVRSHNATYMAKKDNTDFEPTVTQGWEQVWQVVAYDGGAVSPDGTYPEMTVGNATNAQNADNAQNAVNAQRATADENGNNITNTYLTRQQVIDLILPVGKHWIQYQGEQTPAAQFGGTWEIDTDYTGRVLVGSGTDFTLGATGGSADAVVVDHTHNASGVNESTAVSTGDFRALGRRCTDTTENNVDLTECVSSTGVNGAGKNMQPYKVVAIWKRTA